MEKFPNTNKLKKWDYFYSEFLQNQSSLEERFPISPAFGSFLRKCLDANSRNRLTLEEMRVELMIIDNFWLTKEELGRASPNAVMHARKIGLERFV